ncbi:hypothetical protein FGB62_9g29 [Gracilaria domingensis]|nr:hypothetical protein FGB62_9g29 [Gracilaria domingensis]
MIATSPHGSFTKEVLPHVIEHLARFIRKSVAREKPVVMLLDGHASRRGYELLDVCVAHNIEFVQCQANTSYFLQLVDQFENKTFNTIVRAVRDELLSVAPLPLTCINLKLMLGVCGWNSITVADAIRGFDACGLWPMDYRFFNKFDNKFDESLSERGEKMKNLPPRLPSLRARGRDAEALLAVRNVLSRSRLGAPTALTNIAEITREYHTTSEVLEQHVAKPVETVSRRSAAGSKVLSAGLPAQFLTVEDLIDRRKAQPSCSSGVCSTSEGQPLAVIEGGERKSDNAATSHARLEQEIAEAVLQFSNSLGVPTAAPSFGCQKDTPGCHDSDL